MILIFTLLLAGSASFTITAIILNVSNNKGDSKADIKDISKEGLILIEQRDSKKERLKLKHFKN